MERLEPRELLTASHLAEFAGTVPLNDSSEVSLLISGSDQPIMLSLEVLSAHDSNLDPLAPVLEDLSGNQFTALSSDHNTLGTSTGVASFSVPEGEYNLIVGGTSGSSGDFIAQVLLLGDTNGDGKVGLEEQQAATAAVVQSQFRFNHVSSQVFANLGMDVTANLYDPRFDANMDGVVNHFDLKLINSNANLLSVTAEFANDISAPAIVATVNGDSGRFSDDGITNNLDMTMEGSIGDDSPITSFTVSVDGSTSTDMGTLLDTDFTNGGNFSLNLSQLETVAGVNTGDLTNTGAHVTSFHAADAEGNVTASPFEVIFEIDTIAPAPPVGLDLDSSSDSGHSSSDNLTNHTSLTIHTDAEDNAIVELFSSLVTETIASGMANSPVTMSTDPLPSGTQEITATATDSADNTSDPSDPLTVNIDTTPPTTPSFGLDAGSDTGALGDALTTATSISISGTTDSDTSVVLRLDGPIVSTSTADGGGLFNFTNITLPFGANDFSVEATDAAGNVSSDSATITRNDAPVIADQNFSLPENATNGTLVGTITASDLNLGDGDTISFTVIGGSGANLFDVTANDGVLTITDASQLNFETTPQYTLTVAVTDLGGDGSGSPGTGLSATAEITIDVTNVNDAPSTADAAFSAAENSTHGTNVGTVTATDPDSGDTHTFAITGGNTSNAFAMDPNSGQLTVSNPAALDFETQPSFSLTVTATDLGGLSDTATITIDLTDVNEVPTLSDGNFSISSSVPDGFVIGTLLLADIDVNDTHAFQITNSNPNTTLFAIDASTGSISVPTSSGLAPDTSYDLTVQVTDLGGTGLSDTATATISIIPNELPVAMDDDVTTDEDSTIQVNILVDNGHGTDSDPDGDDALLAVNSFDATSASGATVTAQGDATLLYDPSGVLAFQMLEAGASTNDTFTYEIHDAHNGMASATVNVVVTGVNDPPVATDDSQTTDEETAITFDPRTDHGSGPDTDVDNGDIVTVISADSTSSLGATITLLGNSSIEYDPQTSSTLQNLSASDTPLVDSFAYSISDGNGGTDTGVVSVTVTGLDAVISAVGEVFQVDQDSFDLEFFVIENDTIDDAGTLSITGATTSIAGSTAAPSNDGQRIIYSPAPGFLGRDLVTYTVEGTTGGSSTAIATVEVTTGPNDVEDHIHADLTVYVNGVQQADPPANIGVESVTPSTVFTSETHTHDPDGRIHAHPVNDETKTEHTTLGDFFDTWRLNAGMAGNNPDSIFNENQIYDQIGDSNHVIQMFVNGLPNFDFENYVLEDEDEIVISYTETISSETPWLLPIADVDLLGGSPSHVALDAFDLQHDDITFTADSSNPSLVEATVLTGNQNLVITVEDFGVMNFEFFDNRAPRVTDQIGTLAPEYAGIPFHRVIDGFVIQGGDITNMDGTGGSSLGDFDDQFHVDLQHNRTGLLSMAKSGDDTNDSQFFVTEGATRHLDFNHSVFGLLVEGENVRELISNANAPGSSPDPEILMENAFVRVDDENGVLMLKAADGASGEADVTATATDSQGNSVSWTFHVTVTPDTLNGAPFLGEIPATVAATAGQPAVINVNGGTSNLVEDAEGDDFFIDVLERGNTIAFDHTGDDAGVTLAGTVDFEFNGSNWDGGQVVTSSGFQGLFASRSGAYLVDDSAGGASVLFDEAVSSVSFYFTHGQGNVAQGIASAYDEDANLIGSVSSGATTAADTDGDITNFFSFNSGALIERIDFTAGLIDDFNFRRFTFDLNPARTEITVTPQADLTGTLPLQIRVRPTSPSDTGGGFDPDIQNTEIVFADPSPLMAEFGPNEGHGAVPILSTRHTLAICNDSSAVDTLVQAAVDTWTEAIQVDRTLDITVQVADLPEGQLAEAITTGVTETGFPTAGRIVLDVDAAGAGWHLEDTTVPAEDRFDLLTVVLHEVGHLLGFDEALADYQANLGTTDLSQDGDHKHLNAHHHAGDLMTASLPRGVRQTPSQLDVEILRDWYATVPLNIPIGSEAAAVDMVYAELGRTNN